MKLLGILAAATLVSIVSSSAYADDNKALQGLANGRSEFAQRTAFTKDEAVVDAAIKTLELALADATSDEVRFQILNFTARVLVWKGLHTTQAKPVDVYALAMSKADAARNLGGGAFGKYAEGHYWYAVALGRWALEMGKLKVLKRAGEIKEALALAGTNDTLEGGLGQEYEFYGPDRVTSRLLLELPGFAGGDDKEGLARAEAAYTNAPEHTLNNLYYANALIQNKQTPKACEVLKALANKDALTLIPDRAQDALEDLADAKKVQSEVCK